MRRADTAPGRRGRLQPRKGFALLAVVASLLGIGGGLGASLPAQAQDGTSQTGEDLFGSYDLEARALGVQARYEIEGLLPGGSPILDLTVPETLARFSSGPTGYGLASLAYPGGLLVNLGSLLSQTGADGSMIPDYPIKAETFFPSGPLESRSQAVGDQLARSTPLGVVAQGNLPGIDANPVVTVASVRSASQTSIEEGKAVSRARVQLGGINLLGGVITIDTLTTDLVAAHDGSTGAADGETVAGGVRFLGLAAKLTESGLVLDKAPAASGPASPLGSLLDPLLEPLQQLTAPVQALLEGVLSQAVPSLDAVLSQAGISLSLLGGDDVEVDSGASAFRSAGLSLGIRYEGRQQTQLQQLIESIPDDLKPSLGPLPNPIAFLTENHIGGLTLGTATVSALASPPFGVDDLPLGDVELPSFGDGAFPSPDFSTALPDLAGPVAPGRDSSPTDVISAIASGSIPAIAVLLLLLLAPFMGLATTRLADNVLAPVSTSCPSGLDQPPAPVRDP